jgi:hypothetical protein
MSVCSGIRADGGRCKAQAMRGSAYCVGHDPDQAEARQRRASKGGKRGGRGRPQADLTDLKRRISEVIDAVLEGSQDRGRAAVAIQGFNALRAVLEQERKNKETEELAERVEELERRLSVNQLQKGRRAW